MNAAFCSVARAPCSKMKMGHIRSFTSTRFPSLVFFFSLDAHALLHPRRAKGFVDIRYHYITTWKTSNCPPPKNKLWECPHLIAIFFTPNCTRPLCVKPIHEKSVDDPIIRNNRFSGKTSDESPRPVIDNPSIKWIIIVVTVAWPLFKIRRQP